MAQEYSATLRPSRREAAGALLAMVRKELTIMSRYPVEFVASFFQVFLIVVIFTLAGLMFSPGGLSGGADSATTGVMTYGFVLFIFLSDTLWSIGYSVRREQKQGTLEQLYLSPASKFANVAARVVLTLTWTSLLSVVALLMMALLLGSLPFHNAGLGLLVLLLTLSGTFGTGFLFAALTLRLKETVQVLINLVQFAFMILCAPFFPFAALPEPLLWVARAIPLAYGVDLFRSTLMGFPAGFPELAPVGVELLIVAAFGLLMPVAGFAIYRRAEDRVRRNGTLTEY